VIQRITLDPDRRSFVPSIEGITFEATSYELVSELIDRLKLKGDFAVYPLPDMDKPRGQLRLAHQGPYPLHPNGRGVFVMIQPNVASVTLIRRRHTVGGELRTRLSVDNLEEMLQHILSWREQTRTRIKHNEKVEPDKPGTVQGGQFESNRRKH
jgi:hypothetical protein